MGSHSVTCHPTEVRIPPLPPAEAGTRFSDPAMMQGWVDLCYVKADRPGIEPATCKSQVQCPTAEPPRNTCAYITRSNWCCFYCSQANYEEKTRHHHIRVQQHFKGTWRKRARNWVIYSSRWWLVPELQWLWYIAYKVGKKWTLSVIEQIVLNVY